MSDKEELIPYLWRGRVLRMRPEDIRLIEKGEAQVTALGNGLPMFEVFLGPAQPCCCFPVPEKAKP